MQLLLQWKKQYMLLNLRACFVALYMQCMWVIWSYVACPVPQYVLYRLSHKWQDLRKVRGYWNIKYVLIFSTTLSRSFFILTLSLLMSYIYGAPSKARNLTYIYIYIYIYIDEIYIVDFYMRQMLLYIKLLIKTQINKK
jgi:hypothetical protein